MAKQTELAYCKDRAVQVNLKQGFHHCMSVHRCFSDEPCPLNGKFPSPLASAKAKVTAKRTPTPQ
jgi:hypothetical protein